MSFFPWEFLLVVLFGLLRKCLAEEIDLILDLRKEFGKQYSLVFLACYTEGIKT